LKEYIENNDDSISYFESKSDKEKDDIFLREASISFHETILEKSKDERFSKFDELLGLGTFKKIFKAYDNDNGREVAWCEINTEQKKYKWYSMLYKY